MKIEEVFASNWCSRGPCVTRRTPNITGQSENHSQISVTAGEGFSVLSDALGFFSARTSVSSHRSPAVIHTHAGGAVAYPTESPVHD